MSATSALASETVSYQYDVLGRLIGSSTTGGPNANIATAICFEAAGNCTNYYTGTTGGACATASAPTPTPTPAPPTPTYNLDNSLCYTSRSVELTSNDTYPGGYLPIALASITSTSGDATASTVDVTANYKGASTFCYVVRNSVDASATSQMTVRNAGTVAQWNPDSYL